MSAHTHLLVAGTHQFGTAPGTLGAVVTVGLVHVRLGGNGAHVMLVW